MVAFLIWNSPHLRTQAMLLCSRRINMSQAGVPFAGFLFCFFNAKTPSGSEKTARSFCLSQTRALIVYTITINRFRLELFKMDSKSQRSSCIARFRDNFISHKFSVSHKCCTCKISPSSDCSQRGKWWAAAKCWRILQGQRSPGGDPKFKTMTSIWQNTTQIHFIFAKLLPCAAYHSAPHCESLWSWSPLWGCTQRICRWH